MLRIKYFKTKFILIKLFKTKFKIHITYKYRRF